MTVAAALRTAGASLTRRSGDQAALEAEVLLAFVLRRDRAWILARPSTPLVPPARQRYQSLIRRRSAGQPVAYLTGEKEFFSLGFTVTRATLIPRPETEQLVERALALIPLAANWLVADIGTGNGCLAIALASDRPRLRLIATDRSAAALLVARRNARRHRVANRVSFRRGDLLAPINTGEPVSLILANLPYLKSTARELSQLRPEPRLALDGGRDGLRLYRRLFQQLKRFPNRPERILCEIGPGLVSGFRTLAATSGFGLTISPDLARRPRVALLERR